MYGFLINPDGFSPLRQDRQECPCDSKSIHAEVHSCGYIPAKAGTGTGIQKNRLKWIPEKSYRIFRNALVTPKAFLRKQESITNAVLSVSVTDIKSVIYLTCRDFVGYENVRVIDFVRTKICIRTIHGFTFGQKFRTTSHETKRNKKRG